MAWSSRLKPSRRLPSAARASSVSDAASKAVFFGVENLAELGFDLRGIETLEVELQATRQHRHRQLLGVGGREQEFDVRRRLFQGLEQCIKAVAREHVHFVDEVHLVTPARRRVRNVVEQFARVVHLGARGGVHFNQVNEPALVHFDAGRTLAAGLGRNAGFAVKRLGEDARDRGLADAARAGKQEGMVQAIVVERVHQRPDDVLLTHELGERGGGATCAQEPDSSRTMIRHLISNVGLGNCSGVTHASTSL